MEFAAPLVFATVLLWFVGRAGLGVSDRAVVTLARGFFGWHEHERPREWPRGVQEEDRDRPWGHGASTMGRSDDDQPDPLPTLIRLRPTIRSR